MATLGAILLAPLRDWVAKNIISLTKFIWAAISALPKYLTLRGFVLKNEPLWSFRKAGASRLERSPPVVTVMNFKGGVGKTTIAANIAASLAVNRGLRVLLVDLDYQGSLSDLLRKSSEKNDDVNLLSKWLSGKINQYPISAATTSVRGLENVRLVTAEYDLTETEDNQLLRWLIGDSRDDVRSRIARRLANSHHNYREHFDIVIMDAPPRLSLASANALRASHFVIVPTKLQPLSALPIAKMLEYLVTFRARIRGKFEVLGVVCNMTEGQKADKTESAVLAQIETALAGVDGNPVIFDQYIPDKPIIGRPQGSHLAYLTQGRGSKEIRTMFDSLSDELADRMGLPHAVAKADE